MKLETFGQGRIAFRFGNQKINVHVRGSDSNRMRTYRLPARSTCASSLQCRWRRLSRI